MTNLGNQQSEASVTFGKLIIVPRLLIWFLSKFSKD